MRRTCDGDAVRLLHPEREDDRTGDRCRSPPFPSGPFRVETGDGVASGAGRLPVCMRDDDRAPAPVRGRGSVAPTRGEEQVTGIEPAPSVWESDSVPFPRPGEEVKLLVRRLRAYMETNREAPI
ncbi:hypothetical protein Cma02nite_22750 [Cellulomonas marina]|nr:hypothetical protein Cma02nite_22750 [Cellulomonas marina]